MIVIVGGMIRSGSTFSFNIVRELLVSRGGVAQIAIDSINEAMANAGDEPNLIIKSHAPDALSSRLIEKGALRCVCTFRKPEDAIASWMRTFSFDLDKSVEIMKNWLSWHRRISPYALNISYDAIDRQPLQTILEIQRHILGRPQLIDAVRLWRKYDKRRLKKIYDGLEESEDTRNIGFSYYDDQTFFHRNHISSIDSKPAHLDLSQRQIAAIRGELAEFVNGTGNYVPRNLRD